MADKNLHITTTTIAEAGTDQTHLSVSYSVPQLLTVTEASPSRFVIEYYTTTQEGAHDV